MEINCSMTDVLKDIVVSVTVRIVQSKKFTTISVAAPNKTKVAWFSSV